MKFILLLLIFSMIPMLSDAQSKWSYSVSGGVTTVRQKHAMRDMFYEYYGPAYDYVIGAHRSKINSYSPTLRGSVKYKLNTRLSIVSRFNACFVRGKILRSIFSRKDHKFLKTYSTYSKQVSLRANLGLEYQLKKWPLTLATGVALEYLSMPVFQSPEYEYINTTITRHTSPGLFLGIGYWPLKLKDRIGFTYSFEGLFRSQSKQSILTQGEHPHIIELESRFSYHSLCIEFIL